MYVFVALPFPPAETSEKHGVVSLQYFVEVRLVRAPRHSPVE